MLNVGLENIDFQMVSHNYQGHVLYIIIMVNQLVYKDVFKGTFIMFKIINMLKMKCFMFHKWGKCVK